MTESRYCAQCEEHTRRIAALEAVNATIREELHEAEAERNAALRVVDAARDIADFAGQTLLGPDSKHHMGDDATRYHEMGANAAFEQAAEIARAALADFDAKQGGGGE